MHQEKISKNCMAYKKKNNKDVPFRPMLFAVNTQNYKPAKFLVPLIQPLCNSELMINDAFSFASFLRSQQFETNRSYLH